MSESPSGSAKNSLRSKVVAGLPTVNSTTARGITIGSSFTLVTERATCSFWDTGGLPSSVATTVRAKSLVPPALAGASKSRALLRDRIPASSIWNKAASGPAKDHCTASPSGS